MLEFLTSPNWLNPQIDFVVYLQNIRMQIGPIFDDFLIWISRFGEIEFPLIFICMIYWCFDFKSGLYLFSLNALGIFAGQFLKMTACIYRPWVLSDSIRPVEAAFKNAGGYSFPSGHSQLAASNWGGMAFIVAKKNKILSLFLIFLILLVGFSRLYLGVHIPQDVCAGLLIGLVLIFAINALINYCEKNKNRYLYLLCIVNILIGLFLWYVIAKDYPIDYVNGKLLVNPHKAISNSVIYAGWISGIISGVCLCARFFPFDPKSVSKKTRAIRGIVGLILAFSILPLVQYTFDNHMRFRYAFSLIFAIGFVLTAVYPFIFTRLEGLSKVIQKSNK